MSYTSLFVGREKRTWFPLMSIIKEVRYKPRLHVAVSITVTVTLTITITATVTVTVTVTAIMTIIVTIQTKLLPHISIV